MATRPILRLGDPVLRQRSVEVTKWDTPELHELIADMFATMEAADGAGLAAIQIGVPLRIMIFGFESNARYPDVEPIPVTVLINPEYEVLDDRKTGGWEGCLSVPGMRGFVRRYSRIRYAGVDQFGNEISREADGFHARVFQHEFDHLDGVLYPDLIDDPLKFGFHDELAASGIL
ncbi:MAG: peptide deformylase [Woeseiaceae bacterium]